MIKQEEYQLIFRKIRDEDGDIYFDCEHNGNINQYTFTAHLLYMLSSAECIDIIENIEAAENEQYFEEYHGPDSLSDSDTIELIPPNVLIASGNWSIPMTDWKQLMQEWADFQRSNS